MGLKMNKKSEFHQDVARYTFDYLLDSHKKELIIHFESDEEQKIFSKIISRAFDFEASPRRKYVQIRMYPDGLLARYVNEKKSISFKEYVKTIYQYSKKDDEKLQRYSIKPLFSNIIKSGFADLGFKISTFACFS